MTRGQRIEMKYWRAVRAMQMSGCVEFRLMGMHVFNNQTGAGFKPRLLRWTERMNDLAEGRRRAKYVAS